MGTILLVDDERDLTTACERLLRRAGWGVVLAATREEALLALASQPRPALAIVDRQLPDGDGLDILRVAIAAGTPVIMVTGFGSAATRRLSLDEGAAGFLAKPYSLHELLELVRAIAGDGSGADAPPSIAPPPPRGPYPGIHC
jgi:DNA-binding response OmpR family regulator